MEIIPALPAHGPACVTILRDWIDATPWMPMLHSRKGMEGFWSRQIAEHDAWIATHKARVAGFCVHADSDVMALYLDLAHCNRGFGATLLNKAKRDRSSLTLHAFLANEKALAFYKREGFEIIEQGSVNNEEGLPDVKMLWQA